MNERTTTLATAGYRLGTTPRQGWSVGEGTVSTLRSRPDARPLRISARPRDVEIDLSRTALIAVDLQNDFLHEGGWFSRGGRGASAPVEAIEGFMQLARGLRVPVIRLNWGLPGSAAHLPAATLMRGKPHVAANGYGERSAAYPDGVLEAGSWGAALVEGLSRSDTDFEVRKQRFSGFPDTELDSLLRNLDVDTLLFCGLNTDRCVFETLTDAASRGYNGVLLSDLRTTVSPPQIEAAVIWLTETLHGFVAASFDILDALPVPSPR